MSIVTINQLKAKFESGDWPRSADYMDLIDTLAALPESGGAGSTVLNGSGVPSSELGSNGDFYINTINYDIYGPKSSGAWGSATSLVGPTGATGSTGSQGATGATGAQGSTGATGSAGPGVASGGTTGQYLTKVDGTNYNTQWSTLDVAELAQDAVGNNLSNLFTYNDSTGGISLDNAKVSDFLLDGASGNSYGLIGTSTYLDVKNTNGYNKEIELDIAAVKTQLNTDGYLTTSSITPLSLTQSSNNANYPLTISSANEQSGGTGYSDILKLTNSKAGATSPNKYIRMNATGGLEIVNSAYSDTIFFLADNGNLSELGTVNGATLEDTGWTTLSSFYNSYSGSGSPAYRKINNVVYLRGRVSGGTANTTAFNLPSGYRPAVDTVIAVQQFGTGNINYVTVNPDGNVIPNATAAWLSSVIFPVG
jgi:hypothetical protein